MLSALLVFAAETAEKEESETLFYVVGSVFAAWAIIVGVLGMTNATFPGGRGAGTAVMGLSVLLAAGTMAAMLIVSN